MCITECSSHFGRTAAVCSSWLIDWWRALMYLEWRLPVVINVSYFYQFKNSKL